jgi:type II secretory pathway pseudopilin PulG
MKLNYKKGVHGLTLIEALIWFAIFASVTAGVFALYSSTRNANNVATVNKELSTMFAKTENLFASDTTKGLDNAIGLKLGIFPKTAKVSSSGVINNVFGGTITLQGIAPSTFMVTYTNIPSGEVCSNIIKAQKSVGWVDAQVNDTPITLMDHDRNNGGAWAYSAAYVGEACGSNGKESVTIIFSRSR